MTDDVSRFRFLLRQKPICTQSPIKSALGPEKHRELRAKYKLELGVDLLEARCPNSFNCRIEGSGCIGRPFPIDPEILQALKTINVTVTTGNYKGKDVYLAEAIVDCSTCPFRIGCENSCPTQDSFLRRSTKPESNPPENSLVPYEDFEKGIYKALEPDSHQHCEYGDWTDEELPLDCLSERQLEVITMRIYKNMELKQIADKLDIKVSTVSIHLSRAISKMEEFGLARKAIRESKLIPSRVYDYYVNNMTQQEIADKEGISQPRVVASIKAWYNINIPK